MKKLRLIESTIAVILITSLGSCEPKVQEFQDSFKSTLEVGEPETDMVSLLENSGFGLILAPPNRDRIVEICAGQGVCVPNDLEKKLRFNFQQQLDTEVVADKTRGYTLLTQGKVKYWIRVFVRNGLIVGWAEEL